MNCINKISSLEMFMINIKMPRYSLHVNRQFGDKKTVVNISKGYSNVTFYNIFTVFYTWLGFGFKYSGNDTSAYHVIFCTLLNNNASIVRKGIICKHAEIHHHAQAKKWLNLYNRYVLHLAKIMTVMFSSLLLYDMNEMSWVGNLFCFRINFVN